MRDGSRRDVGACAVCVVGVVGGAERVGRRRDGRVLPQQHQPQPALRDGGRAGDGHGQLLDARGQRHLRGQRRVRHARHGHPLQLLAPRHRLHRQQAGLP